MTWSPITVALPVMQGVQAILVMAYQKVTAQNSDGNWLRWPLPGEAPQWISLLSSAIIITNIKDNKSRTWKLILTTLKRNGRSWTRRSTGCYKDDRGEILEFLLEAWKNTKIAVIVHRPCDTGPARCWTEISDFIWWEMCRERPASDLHRISSPDDSWPRQMAGWSLPWLLHRVAQKGKSFYIFRQCVGLCEETSLPFMEKVHHSAFNAFPVFFSDAFRKFFPRCFSCFADDTAS